MSSDHPSPNGGKLPASDEKKEMSGFFGIKRTVTNLFSKWFRRPEGPDPPILENEIEMFLHLPKRPRLDNEAVEEEQPPSQSVISSPPECEDRESDDVEALHLPEPEEYVPRPRIRRVPPWRLPHERSIQNCALLSSDDSSDSSETPCKKLKPNTQQATNQTSMDLSQHSANDESMWNRWHYKQRDILNLNIPVRDSTILNRAPTAMTFTAYTYNIVEPSVVMSNSSPKKDITVHMSSSGKQVLAAMNESVSPSLSAPKQPSEDYKYFKLKSKIVLSLYNNNPNSVTAESSDVPETNNDENNTEENIEMNLNLLQMEQELNIPETVSLNENPNVQEESVTTVSDDQEKVEDDTDSEDNISKASTTSDNQNNEQSSSDVQSSSTNASEENEQKSRNSFNNSNYSECAVDILISEKTTELYNTKCSESNNDNKIMFSFNEPSTSHETESVSSDSSELSIPSHLLKCDSSLESNSTSSPDIQHSKQLSNNMSTSEWQCGQCGVYQSCINCHQDGNFTKATLVELTDDAVQTNTTAISGTPASLDCSPTVKTEHPSIATVRPQSSFASIFDRVGCNDYTVVTETGEPEVDNMPEQIEPHVLQQVLEFAEGDSPSKENRSILYIVDKTKPHTTVSLISPLDQPSENPVGHTFTYRNDHSNLLGRFISPITYSNFKKTSKTTTTSECNSFNTHKNEASETSTNRECNSIKTHKIEASKTSTNRECNSFNTRKKEASETSTNRECNSFNTHKNEASETSTNRECNSFKTHKNEASETPTNRECNTDFTAKPSVKYNNSSLKAVNSILDDCKPLVLPNSFNFGNNNELTVPSPFTVTNTPTVPTQFGIPQNKAPKMFSNVTNIETTNNNNQFSFDNNKAAPFVPNQFSTLSNNEASSVSNRYNFNDNNASEIPAQFPIGNISDTTPKQIDVAALPTQSILDNNQATTTPSQFGFNGSNASFKQSAPMKRSSHFAFNNKTTSTVTTDVNHTTSSTAPSIFTNNNNVDNTSTTFSTFGFNSNSAPSATSFSFGQNNNVTSPTPSPFNQNNNSTLPTPFAFNQNNNATSSSFGLNNNNNMSSAAFSANNNIAQKYSFNNIRNGSPRVFPFNTTLPDVTQNERAPPRRLFRFGSSKSDSMTRKMFNFGRSSTTDNPASDFNFGQRIENNVFKPSTGFGPRPSASNSTAVVSPFNSNPPSVFSTFQGEDLFRTQSNTNEMSVGDNSPTSDPMFGGMQPALPPVTTAAVNRRPRYVRAHSQDGTLMRNMSQMLSGSPMQDTPMSPDPAFMESSPQTSPFNFTTTRSTTPPTERQEFNFATSRQRPVQEQNQGVYAFGESQPPAAFPYNDGRSTSTASAMMNPLEIPNFVQPSPSLPPPQQGLPGTFTIGVGVRSSNPTQVRKVRKARRTLR